jgi:CheY-like chemotaxis protein
MHRDATKREFETADCSKTLQPKCRVLLIDDSPDTVRLIEAYLNDPGILLTSASSGKQGVGEFRANSFDLVLMDMHMPGMDGYETTREIRRWEAENHLRPTPIAALTAQTDFAASSQSLSSGCTLHLSKPIRRQTLLQIVSQYGSPRRASSKALGEFISSPQAELAMLREAIEAADPERVALAAGRLKPVALACGPSAVGELDFIVASVHEQSMTTQAVERLGRFLEGPIQTDAQSSQAN